MKKEKEHRIPLPDRAAEIIAPFIEDARQVGRRYVFAGGKPGKPLSNAAMSAVLISYCPSARQHSSRFADKALST
jgi:hypothetical protein